MQFITETLSGSTGQTEEDLHIWLTAAKLMFNAPLTENGSCFPHSHRYLFICLGKKAWADETRALTEAENGSIMSVGRLTSDIL